MGGAGRYAQALGDDGTGLAELEKRLLDVIRSPWIAFMAVPATVHVLLAISVGVMVWIKPPHTLEPTWRNGLLAGFGSLAFLPLTGSFSRVLATWILLKGLLERIASHPAVAALKALPPALVRPLGAQLGVAGTMIHDLAYPLRVLGRLARP